MLWDLYGEIAGQGYRSWNTTVKLVWNLPRSTHNYFVENLLAKSFDSVRKKVLSHYVSFLQRLGKSVSTEVRLMSRIAAADIRSGTGMNVFNMKKEFKLNPWLATSDLFKKSYKQYEVPEVDSWRLPLLTSLLTERQEMDVCGDSTEIISGLIDSLCYS